MDAMRYMVTLAALLVLGCAGRLEQAPHDGEVRAVDAEAPRDAALDACSAAPARWEPYCSEPARPFVLSGCADADVVPLPGMVCRAQANTLSSWYCCVPEG